MKKAKKSLAERIEELKEEVDAELTRLSELHRPSSVPAPWLRLNWLTKTGGNQFEAYLLVKGLESHD